MQHVNERDFRRSTANVPEATTADDTGVGDKDGSSTKIAIQPGADHTADPAQAADVINVAPANVNGATLPQSQPRLVPSPHGPPDPFSPEALRLSQDFVATLGVKKVLTTVSCRKPNPHEFFRVRPGDDWQLDTGVFEDKINREIFLVQRDLWAELAGEVRPVHLALAVNRQGDVFVWALKLPGPDGRTNAWYDSALAAARLAEAKWVRMTSNMTGGMYDVFEAAGELSEPVWPDLSFTEILKLCFEDRFIQSVDHPVIRALRGLA